MNEIRPLRKDSAPASPSAKRRFAGLSFLLNLSPRAALFGCLGCTILTLVVFVGPLSLLLTHALRMGLDSYILLIPFISAYLIYSDARRLPRHFSPAPAWAGGFFFAGIIALTAGWRLGGFAGVDDGNGYLSVMILAWLCWVVAVGFFFLGKRWMAATAFPVGFLIFMVPLPNLLVSWLENVSKTASAGVAGILFDLVGTPNVHDGPFFQLPGIAIEVAQECSGIRSSLTLLITGLLAAHLFLQTTWRRVLLVALVIPLGFLRNGFRILVIGQLCTSIGPQMIHSFIHTRGGPIFFALSLLPLFIVIRWLRRGEQRNHRVEANFPQPPQTAAHP